MHLYCEYNGRRFPAAAICGKDGRPLLSWRVQILPYLEEEKLYKQFKLDEPWDSQHNLALLPQMPTVYRSPSEAEVQADPGNTFYQVFVGPGAAFEGKI